jgi:hypothetical protein
MVPLCHRLVNPFSAPPRSVQVGKFRLKWGICLPGGRDSALRCPRCRAQRQATESNYTKTRVLSPCVPPCRAGTPRRGVPTTASLPLGMKKPAMELRAGFLKTKLAGRGETAAAQIKTTGANANKHQTKTCQRVVDGLRNNSCSNINSIECNCAATA